MGDAGHQLPDRRKFFRLEQLCLRGLEAIESRHRTRIGKRELIAHELQATLALNVLGHVLGDLHDRRAPGTTRDRERRHAENLPVGKRDFREAPVVGERTGNRTGVPRPGAESHVGAGGAAKRLDIAAQVGGQRHVAAKQRAFAVEHGNRIADRVEGPFPFAFAADHELVEARALYGNPDLSRDDADQALIRNLESSRPLRGKRHRAEQLVTREDRHAQRTNRGNGAGQLRRQQRAEVVHEIGGPAGNHLVARPRHHAFELGPDLLHVLGAHEGLFLEGAGRLILQSDRTTQHAHCADHALQGARQHIAELQRPRDPISDLIARLQLPDEPPVVEIHPPAIERSADRVEQLRNDERLLHERERRQLIGLNRGGDRRAGRQHDDLGVGRVFLDVADGVEPGLRAKREIDDGDIEVVAVERGVRRRQRGGAGDLVAAHFSGFGQHPQQGVVVVNDEK